MAAQEQANAIDELMLQHFPMLADPQEMTVEHPENMSGRQTGHQVDEAHTEQAGDSDEYMDDDAPHPVLMEEPAEQNFDIGVPGEGDGSYEQTKAIVLGRNGRRAFNIDIWSDGHTVDARADDVYPQIMRDVITVGFVIHLHDDCDLGTWVKERKNLCREFPFFSQLESCEAVRVCVVKWTKNWNMGPNSGVLNAEASMPGDIEFVTWLKASTPQNMRVVFAPALEFPYIWNAPAKRQWRSIMIESTLDSDTLHELYFADPLFSKKAEFCHLQRLKRLEQEATGL